MTILLQKISIHAPSRERHDKVFGYQERYAISIHAPSRERPIYAKESIDACYNFNPRSLTGATSISLSRTVRSLSISIHAPSRERRGPADRHNVPPDFNPRSLTGATLRSPYSPQQRKHFNPRSLAGATSSTSSTRASGEISIHAPLRERRASFKDKPAHKTFQSTLPCGSDLFPHPRRMFAKEFQSTLPCGSDYAQSLDSWHLAQFQSTLPCGSDLALVHQRGAGSLFQSTLPCGSDRCSSVKFCNLRISIHAPLRERLHEQEIYTPGRLISIHAPLRERPIIDTKMLEAKEFQSTLPCGSD